MVHSILFTGHMIDGRDREEARFPAEKEDAVKSEIQMLLNREKENTKYNIKGLASGACGGDILFHESCEELAISSEIFLPASINKFKKASVSFAGEKWDKRFDKLVSKLPIYILEDNNSKNNKDKNIYELTNSWMLRIALENGGKNMTLIALWDRKVGDGSGGTEHMINIARDEGAIIKIININKI